MRNHACLLIGLVLAIVACDIASPQMTSEATSPTAETGHPGKIPAGIGAAAPSPIPTEAVPITPPQHGMLLYQTPFGPAWPLVKGDKANGKAVSGGYQVDITQPWAFYLYTTHVGQSNFFAEITVTPQQCPAGNGAYGMIFHYQSDTAYRFATIWCSGRYSVMERTGPLSAITLDEDVLPEEINPSTGEHIVGLRSAANKLTLSIDDRQIAQVDVTNLPTGDVGPYAETTGDPLSVLFTHLSVYYAE
jgi:hypothetical protein